MDNAFGDWSDAIPAKMRGWPEDKLLSAMKENRGGVYDSWARAELARRQNERISQLISSLTTATDKVHDGVSILASSSDRLERLTIKLNKLTYVLIALTFLAVVIPVFIEVWHAYYPEKPAPVTVVLPRPSVPPL